MYGDQPSCDSPVKYQSEPLSARMIPYFFIAIMIASAGPENGAVSNVALSRRRSPMGGSDGAAFPAAWVAGWMYPFDVLDTVKRMAWRISPAIASSKRTRPGRIGKPAASADVQPSG